MSMAMASRAAAAALRAAAAQRYGRPSSSVLQSRSAATAAAAAAEHPEAAARKAGTGGGRGLPRGDYVPVYMALGLIALSAALGPHTARQQLAHAPNVYVDKKKREAVPEVALDEAERYVGRSLFRKVAHVQDDRSLAGGVADSVAEYPCVAASCGYSSMAERE